MKLFITTNQLKKYIMKEAPKLNGVYIHINRWWFIYIVEKRPLIYGIL